MNPTHRTDACGGMPCRTYGKSGDLLSIIGMGGIVVMNAEPKQAARIVAEAVEQGVNYFDVAPSYGDAEEKLGPALEPYRKGVFLACKTAERSREGARREFEQSLKRLRTDYFDLYQLHGITDVEKDVDTAFAKGGAMEVLLEARRAGIVRHLGFSAHSEEAALAAMDRFDFDSLLFPFNFATYMKGRFGPRIVEKAKETGVTCLALKAMARQSWSEGHPLREKYSKAWYEPLTDRRQIEMAIRFTLSLPIAAALPPGEESLFRMALEIGKDFRPITGEETEELCRLAGDLNVIFQAA